VRIKGAGPPFPAPLNLYASAGISVLCSSGPPFVFATVRIRTAIVRYRAGETSGTETRTYKHPQACVHGARCGPEVQRPDQRVATR
jgi:hypothetical protein